ncbi:MAG TPA: DNA methyltransferase [Thermomicrobiales bacterium]|jgi:hypothetical protein|nr:DNA methyltransferase [Thermomicrobiales bacterium]
MARISWNEIESRAEVFVDRWQGEIYERGESQSFWTEFLDIYGIDRRRQGAFFEYAIKKRNNKQGFIDLFWPGKLLAEQKSGGKDLGKAGDQALDYLPTMPDHDLPRMIVTSDFGHLDVLELATQKRARFPLADLPKRVELFGFLIEDSSQTVTEEDPVNRDAAEGMARLHNQLRDSRYTGHDLELLLVRIMFCLFADDARIFERGTFERYIKNRTSIDGSDLGSRLNELFQVLDTPEDQRQTTLDQDLQAFPYINGGLFAGTIRTPACSSAMRRELLGVMKLDWSTVSPAIFGAMFQGVMDETERRNLGAHYTSERNILRVIKPLFLDSLYDEYARVRTSPTQLRRFHQKLATINVLDPACGCGNFLVITYRELRRLEHKVIKDLHPNQLSVDVTLQIGVNVDQMHGIEIEEFPSRIAQTALWLTDHQMNLEASRLFGQTYTRLPLTTSANIRNTNALTTDWEDVVPAARVTYVLGNPPFLGHHLQSATQKREQMEVMRMIQAAGVLDFVANWYVKALQYVGSHRIEIAFVSTNSITQGEQASILWEQLLYMGARINFAHRTFKWINEAKGIAAVYCVVIGFAKFDRPTKRLFDYASVRGEPIESTAKNINPYLVNADDVLIMNRSNPISHVPRIMYGNKPTDGGYFLLTDDEYQEIVRREPQAATVIKPFISAREFLNNIPRWVIWLPGVSPATLRQMPLVLERVEAVRKFRAESKAATTRSYPYHTLFRQVTQPLTDHVVIPAHSSEGRDYIPMGFFSKEDIVGNSCFAVEDASLFHFAVLTSVMHMAWVRAVCGRLKSDYRYSKDIVYNNFPWPDTTDKQRDQTGRLGQAILDARARYPDSTLADLYDPLTMPPDLRKAHDAVDRAVDRLYAPPKDLHRRYGPTRRPVYPLPAVDGGLASHTGTKGYASRYAQRYQGDTAGDTIRGGPCRAVASASRH